MFSLNNEDRTKLSDSELIERYRYSYDNEYIGELYQRYSHMLYGVCLKYMKNEEKAKDVVMDVFEKVLRELKRHDVENFRTWVYTVAKNECLMLLRKENRQHRDHDQYRRTLHQIMESELPPHLNGVSQEETDRRLEAAIDALKLEQRRCIRLFYFEKKSYEEIQKETGYSFKEVKSHLQNGKRNLKIKLEKEHE